VKHSYSVVMPAYNAASTIAEAIASVMTQSVAPRVIHVIDDGSDDATAEIAAAMGAPVKVLRKENGGPGSATTAGLRLVETDFVATLDADDLWLPGKMQRQIEILAADPGLSGIFALARLFHDGERPDPDGASPDKRLWTRTTMVYRMDHARAIGDMADFPGYIGEFIDWISRGRDLGHRVEIVEEVLAMRRVRPGSLSYRADAERQKGYLHAVRNAIARKQGSRGPENP